MLSVKSAILRRDGRRVRRRKPRSEEEEGYEGDVQERVEGARRRRNELKAATRGGDLWWDYRWRYFFITVSLGRLSLFSSSSYSSHPLCPFGDVLSWLRLAPAGSHHKKLLGFFDTAYISLRR